MGEGHDFSCDRTQITYFSMTDLISRIGSFSPLISATFGFLTSFFVYHLFAVEMAKYIYGRFNVNSG